MVQYYNITKLSDTEGFLGFMSGMSELLPVFPLFLLLTFFGVSFMFLVNKSKVEGEILDANDAMHFSMFFTLILSIFLYIGNILQNSIYIYVCAVIYLVTAVIRFYNKD